MSAENSIIRNLMICTPHKILFGDQIKKNDMGRAHRTCGGDVNFTQGFGGES